MNLIFILLNGSDCTGGKLVVTKNKILDLIDKNNFFYSPMKIKMNYLISLKLIFNQI